MKIVKRLWKEEEAQDLIEYALLVALIALLAAAAFPLIGAQINQVFVRANSCMGDVNSGSSC